MMIESGSMITIDYTAKIANDANDEHIFDTTLEQVAKNESIFNPNKVYNHMIVVLGRDWIPIGLENAIIGKKIYEGKDRVYYTWRHNFGIVSLFVPSQYE